MKLASYLRFFSLLTLIILLGTKVTANSSTGISVRFPGGDFEKDKWAWPLTSEYQIGNFGRNNTKGLKIERNESSYKTMMRPLKLKPGHAYRLSWWMKIDGKLTKSPNGDEGAYVSVDWYNGPTWVSFTRLHRALTTNNEWEQCSGEFTVPSDPKLTLYLIVYLRRNTKGKVYFDDFKLEELTGEISCYPINISNGQAEKSSPLEMAINITGKEQYSGKAIYSLSNAAGKAQINGTAPISHNRINIDLSKVPTGTYTLKVTLQNPEEKSEAEFQYPVTVVEKNDSKVYIDQLGRCIVNGKPFMPVGWFAAGIAQEMKLSNGDIGLDVLKKSPFNTILPYNRLRFKSSDKKGTEAAQEVLDACAEANQMVIYSLKDRLRGIKVDKNGRINDKFTEDYVNGLKDHPAILAWYTADEPKKDLATKLRAYHRLLNQLDPDHPTFAGISSYGDLPFFGGNYDVLGIDPYPYNNIKDYGHSPVVSALQDARKHNLRANKELALWAVIQAHNIGLYYAPKYNSDEDFFANTRIPTETEARAMAIMEAIGGAKGFIFYSEFDLRKMPETKRYTERWEAFCRIGKLLRNLEPYIMASAQQVETKVKNIKGTVAAAAMRSDDGAVALLIATTSRGGHEATISGEQLPTGLVSLYGITREETPGVYHFTGNNGECDVLFEAAHMPEK